MVDTNEMIQMAGFEMPKLDGVGNVIMVIIGAIILISLVGGLIILYFVNKRYNKRVVLFKKVNGQITPFDEDKGFFEKLGLAGDYWFRLKKYKKILVRPKIEIAKNTYWYYEREDGEWENFRLKDFDKIFKDAGIEYIDEDMRLQRLGIEKNLRENFKKMSFWEQWGGTILSIGFILIVTICLVVLFQKLGDLTNAMGAMSGSVQGMAEKVSDLGMALKDVMVQKTGGIVPANTTRLV